MRARLRRFRWPLVVVAALALGGGGTAYAVVGGEQAGSYRTATAVKGDVESTYSASGTVDAAQRADLAFGTEGKVAKVRVAAGDKVKEGQVIAELDPTALDSAVTKAKADVARAKAQVESTKSGQSSTVGDANSATDQPAFADSTGTTIPAVAITPVGKQPVVDLETLKKQQQAVIEAQSKASAAIAAAKQALAAQAEACAKAYQNAEATEVDAACQQALDAVRDRQDDVAAAQDTLQKALDELAATLAKAIEALAQQPTEQPRQPQKQPQKQPSAPRAETTPQTKTPTAAELAAAQAAVDQAEADLVTAEQARAQASVKATRAGTVASVAVAAGDTVSSGDDAAVIVGGTAVTIAVDVPETKIADLKVGQVARVSTPAQSGSAEGHVSAIGMTGDATSGTVTYPVTVTVDAPGIPLPTGSQALVQVVRSTATDVLTVPLSAVSRRGDSAQVQVWDGTELSRKQVGLGAVGARTVQITKGLEAGDKVVLADLDQAITGASDSLDQRGGFPGGAPAVRFEGGTGPPKGLSTGK